MGLEIERKWLIPALPDGFDTASGQPIDQGYLTIASGGSETRIRSRAGRYVLTTKSGSGLVRRETSIELTRAQYDELWPATEGARVTKVRHELELDAAGGGPTRPPREGSADAAGSTPDSLTIEVDVYTGALAGLIVAEVEFPDEATATAFTPPAWFGADVTADGSYKNHALATNGRP